MEQQLIVMGIRSNPKLDPSSNIVRVLIDMYVDIGDHIALQYGGSEAHKKVTTERSESIVGPIGKVRFALEDCHCTVAIIQHCKAHEHRLLDSTKNCLRL
jgi:hypothetical protein